MNNAKGRDATEADETTRAAAAADAAAPPTFTVCLEFLSVKRELRLQPCGHTFHRCCAFDWMESRDTVLEQTCPNRSTAILAVKNHHGRDEIAKFECFGSGGQVRLNGFG
ncbi:hypothetical protein PRIPAC_92988 [Pristionchus pacificus]|uniref:RING-type domain-containing protein n=1 Tax=Pristionchus pacificus TaxID=54126 RepID=A0A2A6CDB2_PRIPA|nr:hypothetical protein PRIPAC_92988 [Pristionchus pacificus]|eukprot:PDM75991.1 hypothetical protein PRIPAC_39595 [Pristionchus pacificus]